MVGLRWSRAEDRGVASRAARMTGHRAGSTLNSEGEQRPWLVKGGLEVEAAAGEGEPLPKEMANVQRRVKYHEEEEQQGRRWG